MPSPYLNNYGAVSVDDATLAINQGGHAGSTIVSNLAATQTFTLPPATGTGNVYRVFVNITKTGDLVIQVTTTDIMQGGVSVSTDAAGVAILTAATSDTLTMNGSTTGGLKGSHVEFQDVASGTWRVSGFLISSGAEATPFSAAVS
jgi:archaellum component FlaF (FlaF/FlaG flagellin family)